MDDEEPTWQRISALPMLTAHAAEGVRLARKHLGTLREATPYRLDDATVAGVIRTWEVTRDDLDQLFAEQGRRWQQEERGTRHEGVVEHYCALVAEERGLVEEILALAHRLASVTIEKLLAKGDLEVGAEALLGGRPPGWGVSHPDGAHRRRGPRHRRSPGVGASESVHESSQRGEGGGVGSGVQVSVGGEGGEAVEDFSAGLGRGQHSGHAFGGAGFAGGFPLHDPDGDGSGSGGPAFFVGGAAAGWPRLRAPPRCFHLRRRSPRKRHLSY